MNNPQTMRIAIISDIHGNGVALDAVLADLQHHPAERLVCLGDAIQGGPQPAQVVTRLRELACPVVMGNADAWLLSGEESGREQIPSERLRKMQVARAWSLSQLSAGDQAFIASFQPTVDIPLGHGRSLLCFHGSPASFDDVILPQTPEDEFVRFLGAYASHVLTGGHTHLQQIRRLGNSFFFNPGSVGLAYSHAQEESDFRADPWAEYAVLQADAGRMGLEFRRVPFDVQALVRVYRDSGRPFAEEAIAQYAP
jgi:predicted phosphodiesterase